MRNLDIKRIISYFFSIALIFLLVTSCKKNNPQPSEYVKGLADIAARYNEKCPKEEANGTRLESVTFSDKTMTFRMSVSNQAISTINLDETRDSIIQNMSDKLKNFLIKGQCNLEYKYVSDNDSSSIVIIPEELGNPDSKKQ